MHGSLGDVEKTDRHGAQSSGQIVGKEVGAKRDLQWSIGQFIGDHSS